MDINNLYNCNLCPRNCNVNRFEKVGYCGADQHLRIASVCIHRGEEPAISGKHGIVNIFFPGCNLRCVYCQNFQISRKESVFQFQQLSVNQLVDKIEHLLFQGCQSVGFVSPSHYVVFVVEIIEEIRKRGYNPFFVYNTNAYDKVEILKQLEDYIDVYLPDIKYFSPQLSREYSDAGNYPEIAFKALKEMYRQKGNSLIINDEGIAESGIIIRHLILPTHASDSINIFEKIANEVSTRLTISLMSQYYPAGNALNHKNLSTSLKHSEYQMVVDAINNLGFNKGWMQQSESQEFYRPDFNNQHPFDK